MAANLSSHVERLDEKSDRRRSSIVSVSPVADNVATLGDDVLRRMSMAIPNLEQVTAQAREATEMEHRMGFWETVRLYRKAIGYSALMSLAIVMEGYDTALLGSFFGLPQFNEKFGNRLSDGSYQLTAPWQSGLQNGAAVGEILGMHLF